MVNPGKQAEARASEGIHMNHKVVKLGTASRKTLDFSGINWWDSLTYTFRMLYIRW